MYTIRVEYKSIGYDSRATRIYKGSLKGALDVAAALMWKTCVSHEDNTSTHIEVYDKRQVIVANIEC